MKQLSIFKTFRESVLFRLLVNTSAPPYFCKSLSKKIFHFPWLASWKYFFGIHGAFNDLLKEWMSIILRPPFGKSLIMVSRLILSPFLF